MKKPNKILRKKLSVFVLLALSGSVSFASIPRSTQIANDTAIYQNLHEINVKKVKGINFDGDINKLSAQEKRYHEELPLRLTGPMNRIATTKYEYRPVQNSASKRRF